MVLAKLRGWLGGELRLSDGDREAERATVDGAVAECRRRVPEQLIASWDALSRAGTTFTSPLWQLNGVAQAVGDGALRVLTVMRGDALAAVMPMELKPGGFLESSGAAMSDYLDPLTDGVDDALVWRAVVAMLKDAWDRELKAVTFQNVRSGSPARTLLPPVAREAGFVCEEKAIDNAARIALPATWEAYLESLDGHERKELRRKIRKAETQADARLEVLGRGACTAQHLATAMDLIEAADEQKGKWFRQHVRPIFARIGMSLVETGRMRLLMLMLQGKPGACLIDFPSRDGPLLYNSGFDPSQRQWSPGAVTFGMAIRESISRGARMFDLLRGREEYKYRLGAVDDALYRITLHR
jgi:CelD/BcsL family acetyltransferase involved in cellulose biosynthesis